MQTVRRACGTTPFRASPGASCGDPAAGAALDITDVRLRIVESTRSSKLKAFASITIDNVFVIHDLKVIEGHKGLFVAMPSRKTSSGEFKDIAHPIDQHTRDLVTRLVLEEYEKQLAEGPTGAEPAPDLH